MPTNSGRDYLKKGVYMREVGLFAIAERRDWPLPAYEELQGNEMDDVSWWKTFEQLRKIGLEAMTWSKFELSTRARNALLKNDIFTVWDASMISTRQLNKCPGLGASVRREVYTQVKHNAGFVLGNWGE